MSVLLALTGAISYGLSDFLGGILARRTTAWSIAFIGTLGGACCAAILGLALGGEPTASDWGWGVLAGIGNGFGTAFLYRGLASGRMGVVAPISSVGAALVPVAVALATGERPGGLVVLGMLSALPGIWLVSQEPGAMGEGSVPITEGRPARSGVMDGALAGLGFGSLFAALGQIPDEAGILPLALNQAVGALSIVVIATLLRGDWVPRTLVALWGLVCGALGASATVLFLAAVQTGDLTVAAVLTSLYPAVTILLAATVLREHIHGGQAAGLVLCGIAVAFIAAG